MRATPRFNMKGITLIELLMAIVIGGIVVAGIYRVFVAQSKAYVVQDQVVEVQQNIRTAMEILLRDLRMTGFNGDNTPLTPSVTPGAGNITVYYEKDGAVRQVSYLVDGNSRLMRNQDPPDAPPSEAGGDPILTDVDAFNFRYGIDTSPFPDGDGIVDSWVDAGAVGTSKVIAVQVLLAARPSPVNPDLKAVTPRSLRSTITFRNLCIQ
jgi:prepilin-type N-terminal cleavage/methylation domain-containing protein